MVWVPYSRVFIAIVVAVVLVGGCGRSVVGESCYDVELVWEGPELNLWHFMPMGSGRGDLAGFIDYSGYSDYWFSDYCTTRIVRVAGPQVEEVLCLRDEDQKVAVASTLDPSDGLFLVATGFSEWPPPVIGSPCWDSLSYEIWHIDSGLQATFSSSYGMLHIIRSDRFLGVSSPCEGNDWAETNFEPTLYLTDGSGQALRAHTGIGGVRLVGIDSDTRSYFLQYAEDNSFRGFNSDGEELTLVAGEAGDCRFAGAQAGIYAFLCPNGAGSFLLVVGPPSGPAASWDLPANGWGSIGGEGTVVAVGLETGQLQVYRYEHDRLERLWTRDLPGSIYSVVVGQGFDPLISASTDDFDIQVFDLQGRPVLSGESDYQLVGDVGGYVTLFSPTLQIYRITLLDSCIRPDGL